MEKFLFQTRVVYLKSFTQHSRPDRLIPLMMVPFLCGLLLWLSYFESLRFLEYLQTFYMPLSICGVVRSYMMMIVNEKKNRQKENQLIMGLNLSSYYSGWILSCLTWTCISASVYIFMIGSFVATNWHIFAFNQYVIFYTQYLFYSFAVVGQMLVISSLFSDGRKATDVYAVVFIIINYLYYFLDQQQENQLTELALSVFPQNLIVYFWFQKISKGPINFGYVYTLIIFSIQGILGINLYLYFDQIMPNEIGTHKSPLFIFSCLHKKKNLVVEIDTDLELQQQISLGSELLNVQEQVQSLEQAETATIQINQLTKIYNGQSVVNRLNLNLYKNQIFSLLGHNGAGKSTTINMICGLIEKDNGNIKINGLDADKNMAEIRQILGYCSQKDVIYDDLTVYEHLYYYGRLKLLNQQQLSAQIESILTLCQLQQEKHQVGRYLSGGGKRKLCLAIALIGDSQVLLLDEPTTGLDPVSRQQIWSILRSIKQSKCIILTTHYLDEAQELSDYVGIIQQGKLTVFGTVDSIKKQFSVGFNISIECQNENHQLQVLREIQPTVNMISKNDIKYISQNKILRLNIPLENNTSLPQVLEYIESIKNINITFQMTTLEDAYIKIHQEDESEQVQIQENQDLVESLGNSQLHYSFFKQVKSLVLRRIWIARQNKWQYFMYLFVWILLLGTFFGFKNIQKYVIIWLYFIIKFVFIGQQTYYPIYEKQNKIKQSYLSHGATIFTYWISTLLFDFLVILFEQIVFIVLLVLASNFNSYDSEDSREFKFQLYYKSIVVNSIFSFGLNCQSYFATYFYEKTSASNVQLPFFILIYQSLVIILITVLNKNIYIVGLFTPIISFFEGYSNIFHDGFQNEFILTQLSSLSSAVLYFSLIVYLEMRQFNTSNLIHNNNDAISVEHIYQWINNRKILSDVSFSVTQKQIFGLLGPNGAGKTSLFNIISRQIKPTTGLVSIKNEKTELGIVPSFSPLHEDLNLVEHLRIYGLIKGMNNQKIDQFIQVYCQMMDLKRVCDKGVKFLSGGERRKVQLGIALIGGSSVLLMDEPTSGVDPVFRQKFQQMMVKNCQVNSGSLLYTTHSMSEAQRISDVLGILINGEIKFVGTLSQLRQIYDNRVQLSFQMKSMNNIQELQQQIQNNLPLNPQQISEQRSNYYTILIDGSQIRLSQLFRFCQTKSVQTLIDDFEIQQATLEQIFKYYIHQQQYNDQPQLHQEEQQRRSCLAYCCCQI